MKLAVCTIALFLLGFPLVNGADQGPGYQVIGEERHIEVPYAFDPPAIDGYIGEIEWQTEFTTSYFDAFDGTSFREIYPATGSDEEFTDQADLAVTFYMLYDDEYLYFAANVTDQSIIVDSGTTFWRDDGVELLVDGAHDMDEDQRADDPWPGYQDGTTLLAKADGSYFHDYSNGTPYERYFGIEGDWYAATRVVSSRNYYVVEMRLRLDSVASPAPNSTMGLNVGINDDDTGDLSKTALKWTGTEAGPGENPTFKNETHWGTAYLRPYVEARLPPRYDVDEDIEVVIPSNLSIGNHPDFDTRANYTWELPVYKDGEWNNLTSYEKDFVHTFDNPQDFYTLILQVTDPSGVSDKAVTRIHVRDTTPPELEYTDANALEEVPFTYVLNATDNVGISRINWSLYDDGWVNRTTVSPVFDHTFDHPGTYMLEFLVSDDANNTAGGSATISVFDDMPPVITGHVPDMFLNTSDVVILTAPPAFDDTAEGQDTNLSFSWSFNGDFGIFLFEGRKAGVRIDIPGEYSGILTITDRIGLSSYLTFNATVLDNTRPVPDFFLPVEIPEKETFELNASATFDNDPFFWGNSSFDWVVDIDGKESFSDTLEGPVTSLVFPSPGMATVTLRVTDPSGNTANLMKHTKVLDRTPPQVEFVLDIETVDQGQSFFLNITGSSDNLGLLAAHYRVFLNSEDGETEVLSTPFFGIRIVNITPENLSKVPDLWLELDDSGVYRIDLTLQDISGYNSTARVFIRVRDSVPPGAVINRTILYIELGQMAYLTGAGSTDDKGPLTYAWLLWNGTASSIISNQPDLVWGAPGTGEFNITLRVTDTGGNTDEAVCRIVVTEPRPTGSSGTDYTLLYVVWGAAIVIVLAGILILLTWARRRKAEELQRISEE
ncbi:MAG: sugar-binding protein [Thermoplasmatota archaeon]